MRTIVISMIFLINTDASKDSSLTLECTFPIKNKHTSIEEAKDFITNNINVNREDIDVCLGPFGSLKSDQLFKSEKATCNHELTHYLAPNVIYPEMNDYLLKKKIGDSKLEDFPEMTYSSQLPLLIETKQKSLISIDQLLSELNEIHMRKECKSRKRTRVSQSPVNYQIESFDTQNDFEIRGQTSLPNLIRVKSLRSLSVDKNIKKTGGRSKISKTDLKELEFIEVSPQDTEFRKRSFKHYCEALRRYKSLVVSDDPKNESEVLELESKLNKGLLGWVKNTSIMNALITLFK